MKVTKIAHLADIHIENNKREEEYLKVFKRTYEQLRQDKPDLIALVGDLFDNYIQISNEAKIMAGNFLSELASIAPLIITRGNHDMLLKNKKRIDSVKGIVKILNNDRIKYLDETAIVELPQFAENIMWAVWNHGDNMSPWEKGFKKNKKYTYIDLYHDPVYGAKKDNGTEFFNKKLPGVKDFRGDYSFFGDIHKRQFFAGKTKAYCGSLLQRNHGESLDGHGYLLWNIETGEVLERDIPNDYSFMRIKVNRFTDYDALDLIEEFPKTSEFVKVKVLWEAFPADHTLLNENKITAYVEKHYGVTPIFDKQLISEDDIKLFAEGVDEDISQDELGVVYREYLESNGYEDESIEKILDLDGLIQNRLALPKKETIHYRLKYLEVKNFRGYEHFELDFDLLGKVVKVDGLNQVGKTTMFNALSYLYYGTSLETRDSKKFGDLRFINNKLDVNYCWAKGIIEINGELYGLKRTTEVTFKKNGEIAKCPTTLEFYGIKDGRLDEDNDLTEGKKTATQKVVEESIGSFDDFIRTTMTTSDTLNTILSANKAVFIDAILRDAGLDDFEKKLEEFKVYRKEKLNERVILPLNGPKAAEQIQKNNQDISFSQNDLLVVRELIDTKKALVKEEDAKKNSILNQLKPVDESLLRLNSGDIQQEIYSLKFERTEVEQLQNTLNEQIIQLPVTFDDTNLKKYNHQKDAYILFVQEKNYALKDLKYKVIETENEINRYTTEQNRLNSGIKDFSDRALEYFRNYLLNLKQQREHKRSFIVKEIEISQLEESNIKKEIGALLESKICLTCARPLGEKEQSSIAEKIREKHVLIDSVINNRTIMLDQMSKIDNAIDRLNVVLNEFNSYDREKILSYCADNDIKQLIINQFSNIDNSVAQINALEIQKKSKQEELNDLWSQDSVIRGEMDSKAAAMEKIMLALAEEERKHGNYLQRLGLEEKITKLPIQLENIDLKIQTLQHKLEQQRLAIQTNEFNIVLRKQIYAHEQEIERLYKSLETHASHASSIEHRINDLINKNIDLEGVIIEYERQLNEDELFDTYVKCINRNGVPMLLLKKSVSKINFHLSNLLSNVNFIAYFDGEMELKMHKKSFKDAVQDATGCSGKERTFISCALKLALREINKTAKGNLFLLDEITGKLVDNSIDEFKEFLVKAQDLIEHIFIIEHTHPIEYDTVISVTEKDGISSLNVVT